MFDALTRNRADVVSDILFLVEVWSPGIGVTAAVRVVGVKGAEWCEVAGSGGVARGHRAR